MFDSGLRIIAISLAIALFGFSATADQTTPDPNTDDPESIDRWAVEGWPVMQEFCLDCHNELDPEAELDLSKFGDPDQFQKNTGSMKRILELVRFGAMPPEDSDHPSDDQRKSLVEALDNKLYAAGCDTRWRPGRVTARRLNRAEYNHSIRDLFGIDLRPASDFPADEVGAGFDNNGDVLSLSPILMEKYMEAAERVASEVIVDPTTWPTINETIVAEKLYLSGDAKLDNANGWFIAPDTFVWIDIEVPTSGLYKLTIRGGRGSDDDSLTPIAIHDETGKLLDTHRMKYFGGKRKSIGSERKIKLSQGKQRLFLVPLPEQQQPKDCGTVSERIAAVDQPMVAAAEARRDEKHQRNTEIDAIEYPFLFRQIELRGPVEHSPDAFPDAHNRFVLSKAKLVNKQWRSVKEAAAKCLKPILRRAFRDQITDEEIEPYVDLVSQVTDRGESFYRGLQVAITGILVSPRFLFRIETPPEDWKSEEDGSVRLTQHQLATRISYFLWSSTPDDQLLEDADNDQLRGDRIDEEVSRMLADPKADALATQFAAQWLGLRNLERHEADAEQFESFTPSLRTAMKRETELLFLHMVRQNRPISELLNCDFTFVNNELALHYGITGVVGNSFQRVSLADFPRRGVLSHASVLTLTSNPDRTSPVKRGKWILENVFGTPPPDPPAGVPGLEATKTAKKDASFRKQLELHRANPVCASCHRVMDQLGFGLEQFDPIGRFRKSEKHKPVDASGELPGGRSFDGAVELTQILADSEVDGFAGAVTERLMTFALGRELSPVDRCTVKDIVNSTVKDDYQWIELILEVVRSRPFQYYEVELQTGRQHER